MGSNDADSICFTQNPCTLHGVGDAVSPLVYCWFFHEECALGFQPGKASRRADNGRCVLKARSLTAPSVFAFPCLVRPRAACWRPAAGVQIWARTAEPAVWSVSARSGRRAGRLCPLSGWGGWAVHPCPTHCCRSETVRCKS